MFQSTEWSQWDRPIFAGAGLLEVNLAEAEFDSDLEETRVVEQTPAGPAIPDGALALRADGRRRSDEGEELDDDFENEEDEFEGEDEELDEEFDDEGLDDDDLDDDLDEEGEEDEL